ncbi:MAG: CtsR family transcriptional regulator [Ruminococcus sp.]|nr:CtsR family transcriptional regulator [Ruminococcus sp.]MDD6644654.1 CtsR family transcriptional regulator [Oscillospiraceae bacterium]
MRMSDLVAQTILEMLDSQNGNAEIQRNELATTLGCVPSQINYVITSRFTPEQGYVVESRRGGGGYIRITRIKTDDKTMVMHVVNSIGDSLDKMTAEVMLKNLYREQILDRKTANVMAVALSDRALRNAPQSIRDNLRADIFKNMLISTLS